MNGVYGLFSGSKKYQWIEIKFNIEQYISSIVIVIAYKNDKVVSLIKSAVFLIRTTLVILRNACIFMSSPGLTYCADEVSKP